MNRRGNVGLSIVVGVVLLAPSSGYDFWRGYHEDRSIEGGIIFTVFGFGVLGLIVLWDFMRSHK